MKKILKGFELVSCLGIVGVVVLTMLQAVLRSFFNTGLDWANEVLYFSQILLVYLIVPVLFGLKENIRVDVFLNIIPDKIRNWVEVVLDIISLIFCAVFLYSITLFLQKTINNSQLISKIPNYIYYGPLWLGFLASSIIEIVNIIKQVRSNVRKEAKA